MPEYSSTTLTPTNETKVPAMQGNNSGNFQLDALKAYILAEKAQANGLASLDATGKLVSSQIPDNLDDVLVYGSYALLPATGVEGKIYITADTNSMYRWDASLETPDYVMLAVDLEEYATKAELQAETNQRKASDSRLESRLENLEQKAGDYTTVQYRGTNAVPTGKAKNGLVEKIVGKSRAWNQLVKNGNFSDTSNWTANNIGSISASNNELVCNVTTLSAYANISQNLATPIIEGHKYLIMGSVYVPTAVSFYLTMSGSSNRILVDNPTANAWNNAIGILTATSGDASSSMFRMYTNTTTYTSGSTLKMRNCMIRDLTPIFPEGVPSTIAECVQKCPDLLKYNAYSTSLVDETLSGAKSVGVNIWDEEWEIGSWTGSTGQSGTSTNTIRSKNYIPVSPNNMLYCYCSQSVTFYFRFYDANHNYLGESTATEPLSNNAFLVPSNAYFMRFYVNNSYGRTYNHDIQICLNSLPDAIKTTYHPYKTDTLSLSETVTLRSAGSVADTDELNVEVLIDGVKVNKRRQTERVGQVDLGTLNWEFSLGENRARLYDLASTIQTPADGYSLGNYLSANGYTQKRANSTLSQEGQYAVLQDGQLIFYYNGTAPTGLFNYELASPVVTLLDPIIDNFIEVEGGGTVETIQTQTPVIDNCLDVGYLTV